MYYTILQNINYDVFKQIKNDNCTKLLRLDYIVSSMMDGIIFVESGLRFVAPEWETTT